MSKVTLRIPLFTNSPDKFIKLMKGVIERHEELGASSPLNGNGMVDMADFKARVEQVEALRAEAEEHYAEYRAKMGIARGIMGISAGQGINTEGTLYYQLILIKKFLLFKFPGVEKILGEFGFHVVIGTAKGVGRPRKK